MDVRAQAVGTRAWCTAAISNRLALDNDSPYRSKGWSRGISQGLLGVTWIGSFFSGFQAALRESASAHGDMAAC